MDITSLTGTRIENGGPTDTFNGTYTVSLIPMSAGNGNTNCSNLPGPGCYSTLHDVSGNGTSGDIIYNDVFYYGPGVATNAELDDNGIALLESDGRHFNVWDSSS